MRIPALTIDILVAVIALAQNKSFELAGEELSLSASAVHKRVRAAEKILGHKLFKGTEEGMLLTSGGRLFYPEAVRAVEQTLLTEEKTKAYIGREEGRVLAGHSTYLPPRLLAFVMSLNHEKEAGIRIEHFPGLTRTLAQQVVAGTLDAAFGDLSVTHSTLLSRQLFEEPLVVCLPKGHPLAMNAVIRPQDMEGEPMIAVAREPAPAHHQEIEEFFADFGVNLNIVADAFGPHEALVMVEQKIGLCLLEASAVISILAIAKPLSVRVLTRKSGLYVREDNRKPSLKAFVDLVVERFSSDRHTRFSSAGRSRI
jgi:DNA-binding transcriptional LysR family regulator